METKYHRRIQSQDKLKALKSVWSKAKTVKEISQEMGITKQTYYQWEKKALAEMVKGVLPKKPGRHPKDYVAPMERDNEIKRLSRENQRLIREKKLLQRKTQMIEGDLKIARIIINEVLPEITASKKNDVTE